MDAGMKLKLVSYESRVLEFLEREYSLDSELVNGFASSLVDLRTLCRQVALPADGEFRAGRIVTMGLTNNVHLLLIGGLRSLEDGNGVVWSQSVRALMEIMGACMLIQEKPAYAPTLLDHIKAGKLYAAAERARPGLSSDIKRLHTIVHPGAGAIYVGHRIANEHDRNAVFTYGLLRYPQDEVCEGATVLGNMAFYIVEKLKLIVSDTTALSMGKIIMKRTDP
jgi:hypothetical protein